MLLVRTRFPAVPIVHGLLWPRGLAHRRRAASSTCPVDDVGGAVAAASIEWPSGHVVMSASRSVAGPAAAVNVDLDDRQLNGELGAEPLEASRARCLIAS